VQVLRKTKCRFRKNQVQVFGKPSAGLGKTKCRFLENQVQVFGKPSAGF
jgi:hypothetical protein